jgi:DNA-binding response OmpR family regulator
MSKILVVEDEAMLRDAFTILLRAHGYDVDEANNGKEALERCSNTEYDLILLDLMMPILDGEGFLREYNLPAKKSRTKIIVLSNLSFDKIPPHLEELGVLRQEVKSNLSTKELLAVVQDELS